MSTNFKVRPPISYGSLLEAGCVREDDDLGKATNNYHPLKMPSNNYVWVFVASGVVGEFVKFGGNSANWMYDFCEDAGHVVTSEHEEGYWT